MKYMFFLIGVMLLLVSCNENSAPVAFRYEDEFRENFKGEPLTIERFNYRIDSSGKLIPDSVYHEIGEWKDGYLRIYSEIDSNEKTLGYNSYEYYPDGRNKTIRVNINGKLTDRYETELDSNGRISKNIHYDSAGKLVSFMNGIIENSSGHVTLASVFKADSSPLYSYVMSYKGRIVINFLSKDSAGKVEYAQGLRLNDNDDVLEDTAKTYLKDSVTTVIKKYRYDNYDSLKNWLQRTELNASGVPVKVTKRKITYLQKNS